jgi:hypothetical protein
VSEWRYRNSAARIDVHCAVISTAAEEKIRIPLTKRERASSAFASSCRARGGKRACARANRERLRWNPCGFFDVAEVPVKWALVDRHMFSANTPPQERARLHACAASSHRALEDGCAQHKIFFANKCGRADASREISFRGRESAASDSCGITPRRRVGILSAPSRAPSACVTRVTRSRR